MYLIELGLIDKTSFLPFYSKNDKLLEFLVSVEVAGYFNIKIC